MSAVRAVVAQALREAAKYNADASAAPAAVFWPDPDRVWEPVLPLLQEAVPILVLGEYDPAKAQGPAIWIRAVVAAPDSVELSTHFAEHNDRNPWIIYLPGHRRSALSDVTSLDSSVSPLVEVALRSNWWPSAHSHAAWTPHSFLGSKDGAGLDIANDAKTRAALRSVLDRLLSEDVEDLRRMGRLDASRLHSLVMTDSVRTLLEWIDDPETVGQELQGVRWDAFVQACRSTYGFDPTKDGQLGAAARLGAREGAWGDVWSRFADSPRRYPNLPAVLDRARPPGALFGGSDSHPDSWPSWNKEQEDDLRKALASVEPGSLVETRLSLKILAAQHIQREESVWGELGEAPLARAIGHMAELVDLTEAPAPGGDLKAQATWYVSEGHRVDDLALRALGVATTAADRSAVCNALRLVYDSWVDQAARSFQAVAVTGYKGDVGLPVAAGTCVVFVDALRFDLGDRLARRLGAFEVSIGSRFAAFPTLTPTGQPAVAPLPATFGAGQAFDAADAQGRSVKGAVFRAALVDAGVQYLDWKSDQTGDVNGIGWTQTNTIDEFGHAQGHALADMLDRYLDLVAERIRGLLSAGWRRVVVVTDHGFLMPAVPALKVTLPLAVTEGDTARKPRVARLKPGATRPSFPVVDWTWSTPDVVVEMISAPGAAAFEAGTIYDHGGLSHQECVTPVIQISPRVGSSSPAHITGIRWTGQRCRIDFEPVEADVVAEVRLSPAEAASTVGGPKSPSEPGEIKILVDEDEAAEGATAYVVLISTDGALVAQRQTTVGGSA